MSPPVFNCTSTIQLSVTAVEGVPNGLTLAYQWYYLGPNTLTFVVVPNNVISLACLIQITFPTHGLGNY